MAYKIKKKVDTGFGKPIWSIEDYKKAKNRTTYDLYVNNTKMLNFETKKDAELWLENAKKTGHFAFINNPKTEIKARSSKSYKLGEMFRDDFDYTGMIKMGATADKTWSSENLNKLFDSYEDVNYHKESEPLFSAIKNRQAGHYAQAEKDLTKFREINKKKLEEWGET